jgi:hypothetical protein
VQERAVSSTSRAENAFHHRCRRRIAGLNEKGAMTVGLIASIVLSLDGGK